MDDNNTAFFDICQRAIEPLSDKLNVIVDRLVSKDDLQNLLVSFQDSVTNQITAGLSAFQCELDSKDVQINNLENEIVTLNNVYSKIKTHLKPWSHG